MTGGDREFTVQPETCPECERPLDANGECRTANCPGPD